MNNDSQRKCSIFNDARGLVDPGKRRAFLESACVAEQPLLDEMEKLLKAGEHAERFFANCIPLPITISAVLEFEGEIAGELPGQNIPMGKERRPRIARGGAGL